VYEKRIDNASALFIGPEFYPFMSSAYTLFHFG